MTASEASTSRRGSLAFETGSHRRLSVAFPDSRLYPLPTGRRKSVYQPSTRATNDQASKTPKYANTYKLKPDEDKRFRCKDVKGIIDSVLEGQLTGVTYNAETCKKLTTSIADEIKDKIKLLRLNRFKIVCVVHIGQQRGQSLSITSRCLWDTSHDRMATSSFSGDTFFACASVFGIYQE